MFRDFSAELIERKNLAGNVWMVRFKINGKPLQFSAGQYVLLCVEDKVRQYSIASSSLHGKTFDLIVEYFPSGLASTYLSQLPLHEAAIFKGPAGVFMMHDTPTDKIFLATGTGIAPIKSMIETYLGSGGKGKLHLFFGLRAHGDVYLDDVFYALAAKNHNFSFMYCLSREEHIGELDETHYVKGHIQDCVNEFMRSKDTASFEYYVCGGKDVVEVLKEYALSIGGLRDKVFFEKFTI